MRKIAISLFTGLALVSSAATPLAHAQTRDDQKKAREDMRAGNSLSLREIERRIIPQMKGMEYLGFEYDPAAGAYRLKFIRDGRVVYVDVSARDGRIINRSR